MRIGTKLLALLMAASLSTALIGCQREGSVDADKGGPAATGKQGPAGSPGPESPAGATGGPSPAAPGEMQGGTAEDKAAGEKADENGMKPLGDSGSEKSERP